MALLGAIALPGAMPVSVLGLVMLSAGFCMLPEDMVLLDGLMELPMLLPMLLWAKAAGLSKVRAQAAVMKKRDIGYNSCVLGGGLSPWH